ncbi:MAG TPA: PadR family transcriptional regulator [Stenomitos sp.]
MALAHAILATLMDCPSSGYDLRKRFEGSVGFFWQASFQQIYRELAKLEEQGLVQGDAISQTKRPDKKVFAVTPEGEAFLQEWIRTPCDTAPLRDELLVKMFAGFTVPRGTILQELKAHQLLHRQRLEVFHHIEQTFCSDPKTLSDHDRFRYLTLRNGIYFEQGWLAWCEEAIATVTQTS